MKQPKGNWTPMAGYEKTHQISEDGEVWSNKHGRTIITGLSNSGYAYLSDYFTQRYVHRLMWESFIGPVPKCYEIDHIDGDKLNNNISNLRVLTHKQNIRASIRLGKFPMGERHYKATVPDEKVKLIRELHSLGDHTTKQIAEATQIKESTIDSFIYGYTRRTAGGPIKGEDY